MKTDAKGLRQALFSGEFTGWHMLAIVIAFFGVVIGVNIAMAFAAIGTFPGLVVENSYVASQHYDELLEKAREQDAAGWDYQLATDDGLVRVTLTKHGSALGGLDVVAYVGRPSTTREDRTLRLATAPDGAYVSDETIPPGVWEVDVEARRGSAIVFRRTQEVFIKEPTS